MVTPTADQVAIALVTACVALGASNALALEIAAGAKNPRGTDYTLSRARAYAVIALVDALGVSRPVAARLCGVAEHTCQTYVPNLIGTYRPKWWNDGILSAVKIALLVEYLDGPPTYVNVFLSEALRLKRERPLGRNVTAEVMGDPAPDRPKF